MDTTLIGGDILEILKASGWNENRKISVSSWVDFPLGLLYDYFVYVGPSKNIYSVHNM